MPFVLFAYRASLQESTGFLLLYGRTLGVPTDAELQSPVERSLIDLDDFCSELTTRMSTVRESAREHTKVSQIKQFHDRKSKDPKRQSDGVFPPEHLGKAYKPFHGPYQVDRLFPNGAEVTSLSGNKTRPIRIALDRVRRCPGDNPENSSFDGLKEMCEDDPTSGDDGFDAKPHSEWKD